jgi:hypothetical protein
LRPFAHESRGAAEVPSPIASQNSDLPPDLLCVVESWPRLSASLKNAIPAIVGAAVNQREGLSVSDTRAGQWMRNPPDARTGAGVEKREQNKI